VDEALFLGDRVAVLGPAGIGVTVDVPCPRDQSAHAAPETAGARAQLLAALGAGPRRAR
jgi:NitT/TauT family transport system ATP-binding protein